MADIGRLVPILNNTGLSVKDPALYQFLYNLLQTVGKISGVAGQDGATGATGATGPMGPMGAIIPTEEPEPIDYWPPIAGPQGNPGTTGSQGPTGSPVTVEDGIDGESIIQIYQTITGGSGALTLLEQHTVSGAATMDFTTCITSAYDDYLFEFIDIVPATNAQSLVMRMSTDGGATYDSGANYLWAYHFTGTGGAVGDSNNAAATSCFVAGGLSNNTAKGFLGEIKLSNPLSAAKTKSLLFRSTFFGNDSNYYQLNGTGTYNSTTAVNAVRFLMTSGNMTGIGRCYGIAKS